MNTPRTFSTADFAAGLHLPLHLPLQRTRQPAPKSTGAAAPIPDEDQPLRRLFTRIIEQGLVSLHGKPRPAHVIVIGAGPAGLCVAHELKRAGLTVTVLEASQRVGGRVKTITEPFTPNLHAEGGAMRLPRDHELVHAYLRKFRLQDQLEPFEQANKLIYLSQYGKTLTYDAFNRLLLARDPQLLRCFPNLRPQEQGKTIDTLWDEAIVPVVKAFEEVYQGKPANIAAAYAQVTKQFDRYSLQTYFEQVAGWSQDCISLYDLGSPHVVLDNAFIESWKDAFLSSQSGGDSAGMQQMKQGMRQIPDAFLAPGLEAGLKDDIQYGAQAVAINHHAQSAPASAPGQGVEVVYRSHARDTRTLRGDCVVFAVPFTVQRLLKLNQPFSVAKMNAIRELRYVEVTKILLQFKTRWWEDYLAKLGQGKDGGLVTDLPIRYTMFPPAGSAQYAGGQRRGVIMASYTFQQDATGTGGMAMQDSVDIAVDNLATIFGSDLVRSQFEVGSAQVWSADAFSGGSAFAYFAPMQKTRLFASMIEPEWSGAAHFAGEHTSYSHGWIEGAFESALRVAYQVYLRQT